MSNQRVVETDILIVGSGMAGLRAAIEAKKYGLDVLLVDKSLLARASISTYAGGAVYVSVTEGQSMGHWGARSIDVALTEHTRYEWGLPYCRNEVLDEIMAMEIAPRVDEEAEYGVKNPRYTAFYAPTNRGGWPHVGPMAEYCKKVGIKTREKFFVIDLIRSGDRVVGAVGLDTVTGELLTIKAKATILATGGVAECWKRNNTPWVATGDGQAMAYRAGATLNNMEVIQFDSWICAEEGLPQFWIKAFFPRSRGELRNAKGEPILKNYFPDEMMVNPTFNPKDREPIRYGLPGIVDKEAFRSRAMAAEVLEGRGDKGAILADLTPVPEEEWLKDADGLSVYHLLRDFDWKHNWVHVYPGALGMWGGIKHNEYGETDMAGLYAVGEVGYVCHLRHCLVFGARAGMKAAMYARSAAMSETNMEVTDALTREAREIMKRPESRKGEPRYVKSLIKDLMMKYVFVLRSGEGLKRGIEELHRIREENIPKLYARNPIQLRHALEAINMVQTSELIAKSSLMRTETRGAFNRLDYPYTDNDNWVKNTTVRMNIQTGLPELGTEPIVKTHGPTPPPGRHRVKGMPKYGGE